METKASAFPLLIPASHQIRSVWVVKSGYLFWLCTSQCIIAHEYGWQHGPRIPRLHSPHSWRPSLIFHLIFWEAQSVTTGYARVRKIAHGKKVGTWGGGGWLYKRYRYVIMRDTWYVVMLGKADWNVVNLSDLVDDVPHADFSYGMTNCEYRQNSDLYLLPWLCPIKRWDYIYISQCRNSKFDHF